MVEIASQVKNAVNYMVGSEEIEPGPGYNYFSVLSPFLNGNLSVEAFAKHIVNCYAKEYQNSLADYTHSAINVNNIDKLEENIRNVANLLIGLISYKEINFAEIIRQIRENPNHTTAFYDSDYVDLWHFYKSMIIHIDKILAKDEKIKISKVLEALKELMTKGALLIQSLVIANTAGSNVPNAKGLSIYFPQNAIHPSYPKTVFAQNTKWLEFLELYLKNKPQ